MPTVLSAIAIGVIIGRHVASRPFITAGIAALLHLGFSTWVALHGWHLTAPFGYYVFTPTGANRAGETASMLLIVILEVYVASVIARRTWERRPRALRINA